MATSLGFCFHVYEVCVGGGGRGQEDPRHSGPPTWGPGLAQVTALHSAHSHQTPPSISHGRNQGLVPALAPGLHGQRTAALAAGASALLFLPVSEGGAGEPALSPGPASASQ